MNKKLLKAWLAGFAQTATPSMAECVHYLGSDLTWLQQLRSTPQDPEWHAEGDVFIHTDWVLRELYALLATEAKHIQGERRQALILGAILHDIGKPKQTRHAVVRDQARIIAPDHEAVGRSYLTFKLASWDLPFSVYWTVLNLVGEHHMPKQLVARDRPLAAFAHLARQVDTELLYWLEVADMRGRTCTDLELQLLYLEEFKALCQQYAVWGQMLDIRPQLAPIVDLPPAAQNYVYAKALYQWEQGVITQVDEALATTYEHRFQHPHLVVLCGPSGAGKSSWLAQHLPDYELISLDELREAIHGQRSEQGQSGQIRQQAKEQLKAALRQKRKVVWDATNLRTDFRSAIIQLGCDYHALVTLAVFILPEETLFTNNRQRKHSIPDSVLMKQLEAYQLPALQEAHQFLLIGEKGKTLYQTGFYHKQDDSSLHSL